MDRRLQMDKLFSRFVFETSANVSLGFASTFLFQLMFYRKRWIMVQGTVFGLVLGLSVHNANKNFSQL